VPGFVSPYASAVTGNRLRPFSIRPLPNRTYRVSEYPALRWAYLTGSPSMMISIISAFRMSRTSTSSHQVRLSPFAMCPAFPDADYYGDSVAIGLVPRRRSRVFRSSYGLAWVRPSTHPYARNHLPVSHRPGLSGAENEHPTGGDAALSQHSGGAAHVPIRIGLEAV